MPGHERRRRNGHCSDAEQHSRRTATTQGTVAARRRLGGFTSGGTPCAARIAEPRRPKTLFRFRGRSDRVGSSAVVLCCVHTVRSSVTSSIKRSARFGNARVTCLAIRRPREHTQTDEAHVTAHLTDQAGLARNDRNARIPRNVVAIGSPRPTDTVVMSGPCTPMPDGWRNAAVSVILSVCQTRQMRPRLPFVEQR